MNQQQATHTENVIVRQAKYNIWLGLFLILFFGGICVLMLIQEDANSLWLYVGFGIFLLVGIILLWRTLLWRITAEADGIHFRNSFGRIKIIPFETLEEVKIIKDRRNKDVASQIHLYSKDGKVILAMESDCTSLDAFFKRLEQNFIKIE